MQQRVNTTNDEQSITSRRLFTTRTTTTTTSTSSRELDVQVAGNGDSESDVVVHRRLIGDVSNRSPVDDEEAASSEERVLRSSADNTSPTAMYSAAVYHDDAACRTAQRVSWNVVDDAVGGEAEIKPETEARETLAHARCTAVARFAPGERDDARSSAAPPDVAADTDVLATVAVNALAGDRSPYTAAARAAARAASAAVGDVIWQVRDTTRDCPVELELSARCVVRSNSSRRQRSVALLSN